jgi:hypothetical protein
VKWFGKMLKSKGNTPIEVITSEEFGELLYQSCFRHVMSFIESLDSPDLQVDKEEIDEVELLIAFMWLFFDRMQNVTYANSFTRMHSCFMTDIGKMGLEKDEMWQLLQNRYDEYRTAHRCQGGDDTYEKVAHEIHKNILGLDMPAVGIAFWYFLTVHIQEYLKAMGKVIEQIHIKDT